MLDEFTFPEVYGCMLWNWMLIWLKFTCTRNLLQCRLLSSTRSSVVRLSDWPLECRVCFLRTCFWTCVVGVFLWVYDLFESACGCRCESACTCVSARGRMGKHRGGRASGFLGNRRASSRPLAEGVWRERGGGVTRSIAPLSSDDWHSVNVWYIQWMINAWRSVIGGGGKYHLLVDINILSKNVENISLLRFVSTIFFIIEVGT